MGFLATCLLAPACGAPSEPPRAAAPASSPASAVAATQPPATVPAALSTAAPPVPAGASPASLHYKGIAASRTAEGFFILGAADAPVTLTDYSDFL